MGMLRERAQRARALCLGGLLGFFALGAAAQTPALVLGAAQAYPSRPLRVIVSFTPGGAADVTARVVGEKLSERLGQPLVIENRPGGGGVLALELLKNAPADGYTLGIASNSNATKPATMPHLPWNLARDFAYIGIAVDATMVLVGNPDRVAARDLRELTALLQAHPGRYLYGSCGIASIQQFAMEKYLLAAGVFATHVPYKGCAVATPEVLSGQIDLALVTLSNTLPYVRSGRVRAFGVTNARRSRALPDLTTFAQSGIPALRDYAQGAWYGFAAPAGTPGPVVDKLSGLIAAIVALPDVGARFREVGLEPDFMGPQAMRERMLMEVGILSRLSEAAHIRAE